MLIVVIGFKTHSLDTEAICVYCGNSGNAAQKAIDGVQPGHFVRLGKMVNPVFIPLAAPRLLTAEEKKAGAEADARRAKLEERRKTEAAERQKEIDARPNSAERARAHEEERRKAKAKADAEKAKADQELAAAQKAEAAKARASIKAEAEAKAKADKAEAKATAHETKK